MIMSSYVQRNVKVTIFSATIIGMSAPKEAFLGKKPNVVHFTKFGTSVYCHVTKDARKNQLIFW